MDIDGSGDEQFDDAELDKELEKELEEDNDAKNPELLDETVFNKFAGGELDLPEDDMDLESEESDGAAADDDSELEAYYEELGIDMKEVEGTEKVEKMLYKKQKKQDVRKEKVETAKRERNQVIDAMMAKATAEPTYTTLTRIIQIVKAIFN